MYLSDNYRMFGMCISQIYLSDGLLCAPNKDRMKNLFPREVNISTNHIEAHKPFGISSYGVRVLDV
jgi:hypothetical protein